MTHVSHENGELETTPEDVFSEHYPSVYRLALSLYGNHADAEDIAQEVFLAILRSLPSFRGESSLGTWVYRITLRIGYRWVARRRDTVEIDGRAAAPDQSLPIDLIQALRQLPIQARMVVLLVTVEGLTHDEAAQVLAIPSGTVASRLHHARKRLAELLAD